MLFLFAVVPKGRETTAFKGDGDGLYRAKKLQYTNFC